MAGLLGNGWEDPQSSAVMALAGGLLRGDFGGGLLGANSAYQQAKEGLARQQMLDLETQQAQMKLSDAQRQRDFLQGLQPPNNPAMAPLYEAAKAGAVPLPDYLKATLPKQLEFNKINPSDYTPDSLREATATGDYTKLVPVRKMEVGPAGQVFNPWSVQPGTVMNDPNKPFMIGQDGGLIPNLPYQQYQTNRARAGASVNNISLNSDKSYFGNVAEGLAKNDVALIDAARSAPDRIASAQRVKEILARNPITGTGAEARLAFNKAFATAGLIDGANVADTETLASNLASQTLDAIKTSGLGSGQGFTDKDRQFLERAKSGNIEMNAESLRRLADLNEQSARLSIRRGNAVIDKLRASPEAGRMGRQLDLIEEPKISERQAPAGQVFSQMPPANLGNRGKFLTDQQTGKRYQSNGMQWVEVK